MKYYQPINDTEVLSEVDIIDDFWERWYEKMVRADKRAMINVDKCIDDWVTVNYAQEVSKEDYIKYGRDRFSENRHESCSYHPGRQSY